MQAIASWLDKKSHTNSGLRASMFASQRCLSTVMLLIGLGSGKLSTVVCKQWRSSKSVTSIYNGLEFVTLCCHPWYATPGPISSCPCGLPSRLWVFVSLETWWWWAAAETDHPAFNCWMSWSSDSHSKYELAAFDVVLRSAWLQKKDVKWLNHRKQEWRASDT